MKRKIIISIVFSVLMVFGLTSCGNRNSENQRDASGVTMNENADLTPNKNESVVIFRYNKDYAFNQKDELRDDLKDAIDNLNNKIDDMQGKADNASRATQDWYKNRIKELKDKRDNLRQKVDKIDDTTEQNWAALQLDLREGWNDIQQSWNNILDRMKADTNNY